MRFPPTSPRLKFTHTQPGGSPIPRRPPRHPPSPSTRSRSLELLDQDEKTSISPVKEPEVQARPRSNSLDGLLDEDGLVSDMKTEDSLKPSIENKIDSRISSEVLKRLSDTKLEDNSFQITTPQRGQNKVEEESTVNLHSCKSNNDQKTKSNESQSPIPVPRQRLKTVAETKSEPVNTVTLSTVTSNVEDEKEDSQTSSENVDPCDDNAELKERLVVTGNDKSTLLKAKSCGAGLDSDESISSNEYKSRSREQGSLLSLPTGAEPKRKKNFMDKCVNKVRSFMRK